MARLGNAIIVTMNYRVGVFGFMAHPVFGHATDGECGLADQREALRWVKRNIVAFGGDPGNVTIAGESAGPHLFVCRSWLL
jgi:para-nitrobenzyl esterase